MFKLAYCGIPHTGGTYTVYKKLREGLKIHNIEVRWVGLGNSVLTLEHQFRSELNHGELLEKKDSDKETTRCFVDHIEKNYDGIIFNVLAGLLEANAARYISNNLIKLEVVHNITIGTYGFAATIKDHVHATIGVSPRITSDLVQTRKFDPNKTITIPNAVNLDDFNDLPFIAHSFPLKLIYLGRIEEASKGILWLPDIIKYAVKLGVDCQLTVAGDGPDLDKLKIKTHQLDLVSHISFLGKINYDQVPSLLAQHHVFLMTSSFEGFGLSLTEAMLAGCVPVSSKIKGVTDFIVTEGENGLLFPIGDTREAARQIKKLQDEKTWRKLSCNARDSIKTRFTTELQAQAYADLINSLQREPSTVVPSLSIEDFDIPSGFKPSLRTYLPDPLKNILRVYREKYF